MYTNLICIEIAHLLFVLTQGEAKTRAMISCEEVSDGLQLLRGFPFLSTKVDGENIALLFVGIL